MAYKYLCTLFFCLSGSVILRTEDENHVLDLDNDHSDAHDKHRVDHDDAKILFSVDSSGGVARDDGTCFSKKTEESCVNSMDKRPGLEGECEWCCGSACHDNGNKCEPTGWLNDRGRSIGKKGRTRSWNYCGIECVEANPSEEDRKYSSVYHSDSRYARSMLDSPQAWSASKNNEAQWLEMDLGEVQHVQGVVVQGRNPKSYPNQSVATIDVSVQVTHTASWVNVSSDCDVSRSHANNRWTCFFENTVDARYVKLFVKEWREHISMRAGAIACPIPVTCNHVADPNENCNIVTTEDHGHPVTLCKGGQYTFKLGERDYYCRAKVCGGWGVRNGDSPHGCKDDGSVTPEMATEAMTYSLPTDECYYSYFNCASVGVTKRNDTDTAAKNDDKNTTVASKEGDEEDKEKNDEEDKEKKNTTVASKEGDEEDKEKNDEEDKEKKNTPDDEEPDGSTTTYLIIGGSVAGVLLLCGGGYFWMRSSSDTE